MRGPGKTWQRAGAVLSTVLLAAGYSTAVAGKAVPAVGRHLLNLSAFDDNDYQEPALDHVFGEVVLKLVNRVKQLP